MPCEIKAVILSTFCAYDIEILHVFCAYDIEILHVFYVTPKVPCVTTHPPIQHKVLFISSFSVLLKYLFFKIFIWLHWVFWGSDGKKNLPAMQEARVRSLGWEDPLEKGMQPTPVFLPGESFGVHGITRCWT